MIYDYSVIYDYFTLVQLYPTKGEYHSVTYTPVTLLRRERNQEDETYRV